MCFFKEAVKSTGEIPNSIFQQISLCILPHRGILFGTVLTVLFTFAKRSPIHLWCITLYNTVDAVTSSARGLGFDFFMVHRVCLNLQVFFFFLCVCMSAVIWRQFLCYSWKRQTAICVSGWQIFPLHVHKALAAVGIQSASLAVWRRLHTTFRKVDL